MEAVKDFLWTSKTALKKAWKAFIKHWIIVPIGFVYFLVMLGMQMGFSLVAKNFLLSRILSFFIMFVQFFLSVHYLDMMRCVVLKNRYTMTDIKRGFSDRFFFSKVVTVNFVFYVVEYILSILSGGDLSLVINLAFAVVVAVLFNPLPEVLYQRNYNGVMSLRYCVDFMKENWIWWLIPIGLITLAYNFLIGVRVLDFAILNPFTITPPAPNLNIFMIQWKSVLAFVIGLMFLYFFMLYRGFLFLTLSTTTRRNRHFIKNEE